MKKYYHAKITVNTQKLLVGVGLINDNNIN